MSVTATAVAAWVAVADAVISLWRRIRGGGKSRGGDDDGQHPAVVGEAVEENKKLVDNRKTKVAVSACGGIYTCSGADTYTYPSDYHHPHCT